MRDDEIVAFTDWHSVTTRPGYVAELDPKTSKLIKVIGSYEFNEDHACGLRNCHQPHLKGWVVMDSDLRETNLGSRCGPKHFPELGELRREFKQALRSREGKDRLGEWKDRAPAMLAQMDRLETQPFGAKWLLAILRAFQSALPSQVWSDIRQRANRGDARIFSQRRRTKEEIDDLVARGEKSQRVQFEEMFEADLVGLEIFAEKNDLATLIGLGIKRALSKLDSTSKDTSIVQIEATLKAVGEAERMMDRLPELFADGLAFCGQQNINALVHLARSSNDRAVLGRLRVQLDPPRVTAPHRKNSAISTSAFPSR